MKPTTRAVLFLIALSALGGSFIAELVHSRALASRNSSGTYSLPSGNPVTTGTTISSTWANNTLSDIGTELTNSLDRSGRGAMTAALQHSSGTVSSPSVTFSAEPASGLYRAGAGDFRMSVGSTDAMKWQGGGVTIPGTLAVTGATTAHAITSGTLLALQNTTGSIAITHATDQPEFHMCDFAADAGSKCSRVVFDPGGSLPVNKPGWQFQKTDDDGGFVANGLIIYRDGSLGIGPGNGTMITASYGSTYSINFGTINANNCVGGVIKTLSGVTTGGVCNASFDSTGGCNVSPTCNVTGADTISISACNSWAACNEVTGTKNVRVRVFQP